MRSYGENRDLLFVRAVIPENPPRGWSPVFGIGFKYFFPARSPERTEFMGIQAWVTGIGFQ